MVASVCFCSSRRDRGHCCWNLPSVFLRRSDRDAAVHLQRRHVSPKLRAAGASVCWCMLPRHLEGFHSSRIKKSLWPQIPNPGSSTIGNWSHDYSLKVTQTCRTCIHGRINSDASAVSTAVTPFDLRPLTRVRKGSPVHGLIQVQMLYLRRFMSFDVICGPLE